MGQLKIALAKEYMDNTTIHGFRYIVHHEVSVVEKVIWALILTLFGALGIYFIIQSFNHWEENPVLRTIDTLTHPLSKEKFPSVTICTNQKYRNINEWRYVEVAMQMIENECFKIDDSPIICEKYQLKRNDFIEIATSILKGEAWKTLDLASLINMLDFKLGPKEISSNETLRKHFHQTLTKMIGDTQGILSPLAVPYLVFPQKREQIITDRAHIKMILNENCSIEQATKYSSRFELWQTSLDKSSKLSYEFPCLTSKLDELKCCNFYGSILTENIDYVNLVMNYGIPGFVKDHSRLAKHLGFDKKKTYDFLGSQLVPFCENPDGGLSDVGLCDQRSQRITWSSDGLCVSFNTQPLSGIYQSTYFLDKYYKGFDVSNQDYQYYNGIGIGKKYSLQVVINTNTLFLRSPFRERNEEDEAKNVIAINDFENSFAVFYKSIRTHPGESFLIQVSPFIATASSALRNLKPKARNCKFSDENMDSKMFKYYTQEGCEFECMIKHAINLCGRCIPWQLPQVQSLLLNNTRLCDMWESYCFQNRALNDMIYKSTNCSECLPNCNQIQMDTQSRYSKSSNYEDICEDESEIGVKYVKKLFQGFNLTAMNKTMEENGLRNVYDVNLNDKVAVCKYLSKNEWSFAMISLEKLTGIRIMQDVRTEFADRLATIGGNLGLLSGFSIISLVEIVYYIYKCIKITIWS